MKQKTKRLITIGTIGSALGTIGATIAVKGSGFLLKLAASLLAGAWHALIARLDVPVWLLLPVAIWILFTLYHFLKAAFEKIVGPQPHIHYVQGTFFGLTWRWHYSRWDITPPFCYCPVCDTMLVWKVMLPDHNEQMRGEKPKALVSCEMCRRDWHQFEGDHDDVQGQVLRQIDGSIRTGEWKKAVERQLASRASRQ